MQILAVGMGQWNGAVVRASNPQRRDVQMMPPATKTGTPSYLVVQWTVDNSSMGLVVNVMEKVDVARANSIIQNLPVQRRIEGCGREG
jgi:hypothetical protein